MSLVGDNNNNNIQSYNILFNNNNVWEIQESDNGNMATCYKRKGSKFNTFLAKIDEDQLSCTDKYFSFDDWKAFSNLNPHDHIDDSLPLIYYMKTIGERPVMEKIRNTKYVFTRV